MTKGTDAAVRWSMKRGWLYLYGPHPFALEMVRIESFGLSRNGFWIKAGGTHYYFTCSEELALQAWHDIFAFLTSD